MQAKVQLICMPYQNITLSSLSIALLSSVLRNHGIATVESYFHFEFARIFGIQSYMSIAESGTKEGLTGELLFAESYHGRVEDGSVQQRLNSFFGDRDERLRKIELYKDYCLSLIGEVKAELVGFSTSCNQLFPSLWLARHIKDEWPFVKIVFGGSACSPPMGLCIKQFYPEVDYVVAGYGEDPLLDLAQDRVPEGDGFIINNRGMELNTLPIPDYNIFLQEGHRFHDDSSRLMLAFESSRGCWWGEKNHCNFCGLNQLEIAFNSKSSGRVIEEIRTLWELYHVNLFATDSILSRVHLKKVMPALAQYQNKPMIFYEVKANMASSDVRVLKDANVLWIQPGIESLSSTLLRLLKKGVRAIQNIALLKWCREEGILVSWNLLCGIPGEQIEDYEEQIALFQWIPHLCPPQGVSIVRVDRHSPYFNYPDQYGWSEIKPLDEYRFLHPQMDAEALSNIAYHFDAHSEGLEVNKYLGRLQEAVEHWRLNYSKSAGLFWDKEKGLIRIEGNDVMVFNNDPILTSVIKNSHDITTVDRLADVTGCDSDLIEKLVEQGILYREGKRVVNIAVRVSMGTGGNI